MIYADYLSTSEMHRWIADTDFDWDAVDVEVARSQPDLLDRVRDAALIESYFPCFTPRLLDLLWDDVNATAIFSVQLYESYKHFHVFNQYLIRVGYRPIGDEEIVAVRRRNADTAYDDATALLTRYLMSEHFAAHHFFADARLAREPVLSRILQCVGRDEVRHAQFAYDLLEARLRRRPEDVDTVHEAAANFRHVGLDVVDEMPVAEPNDFAAIVGLNAKLQRLTGRGLGAFAGASS